MSAKWGQVVGLDPYALQLSLPAGEAVARWLKNRHPQHTAKRVAQETGLDPRTVENILAGHLSGSTITTLIVTYRSPFLLNWGAAVMGASVEDDITRELEEIADERRCLDDMEASTRALRGTLRARGAVDGGGLRLVHPQERDAGRDHRRQGRGLGSAKDGRPR